MNFKDISKLDELISNLNQINDILMEGKKGISKAEAKQKKEKNRQQKKKAELGRAKLYSQDKVIKKSKTVDTSKFANDTTFKDTPEDSHVHTDGDCKEGLRGKTSSRDYAYHANDKVLAKKPCKKFFPTFSGKNERARIAGSLRMAYETGNKEIINKVMNKARELGMKPKGALYNELPGCDQYRKTGKLPKGMKPKDCVPHGEGGTDEWLRKYKGKRKGAEGHEHKGAGPEHEKHEHKPRTRPKHYYGHHGRHELPGKSSDYEKAHAKAGARWGEIKRGKLRHQTDDVRKAHPDHESDVLSTAKWRKVRMPKRSELKGK